MEHSIINMSATSNQSVQNNIRETPNSSSIPRRPLPSIPNRNPPTKFQPLNNQTAENQSKNSSQNSNNNNVNNIPINKINPTTTPSSSSSSIASTHSVSPSKPTRPLLVTQLSQQHH